MRAVQSCVVTITDTSQHQMSIHINHVTDAWDTTQSRLQQVSLDLFWCGTESLASRERKKRRTVLIDIPRTGDSTWSLKDSKRELIYPHPTNVCKQRKVT